jgi:hypothetical protein
MDGFRRLAAYDIWSLWTRIVRPKVWTGGRHDAMYMLATQIRLSPLSTESKAAGECRTPKMSNCEVP